MAKSVKLILSGQSGAGKGKVSVPFLYWSELELVKSLTTRAKRPIPDPKYIHVSRERFLEMEAAGEFLESCEHFGNLYGTPRSHIRPFVDQLIEVDSVGASKIKAQLTEAKSVYMLVRSPEILERRRYARPSGEDESQHRMRREKSLVEVEEAATFDYWLVNDDVVETATLMLQLVTKLRFGNEPDPRIFRDPALLSSVQDAFRKQLATA
jgi:guanylate kinase